MASSPGNPHGGDDAAQVTKESLAGNRDFHPCPDSRIVSAPGRVPMQQSQDRLLFGKVTELAHEDFPPNGEAMTGPPLTGRSARERYTS